MELTAEDRFAIQDLYAHYCVSVDRNDPEGWADLFTEDGSRSYDAEWPVAERAGKTFTGRQALMGLVIARRSRHWHSLPVLTDKGDHIESVVYGAMFNIDTQPPVVAAHLTYTDELVRLDDGSWRFRSRHSVFDQH